MKVNCGGGGSHTLRSFCLPPLWLAWHFRSRRSWCRSAFSVVKIEIWKQTAMLPLKAGVIWWFLCCCCFLWRMITKTESGIVAPAFSFCPISPAQVRCLWAELRRDEPHLLSNFEDFLARVTSQIIEANQEKREMESALKRSVGTSLHICSEYQFA